MADLGLLLYPPAQFGRPDIRSRSRSRNSNRNLPGTPTEGQNAAEPIMIGSSDDEDERIHARPHGRPGRGTMEEQRTRLHNNRTGTPIPRAREDGLRIMSPPPPLPGIHHHLPRRPDWHHMLHRHEPLMAIQQRLLSRHFNLGALPAPGDAPIDRLLGLFFEHPHYMGDLGGPPPAPNQPVEEYDVRMTHASKKPRPGFTFDFAPDEDEDEDVGPSTGTGAGATNPPAVRTRTTITITDSPPVRPVDRKGKGRAVEPEPEVLDLEDSADWSGPSSSAGPRTRKQVQEVIEVLSDDEDVVVVSSTAPPKPEKVRPILVCAGCDRPLRMGGDRLWALRCGHMIDSRCYKKLAERPIPPEDMTVVAPEADVKPPRKRRKTGGGRKAKPKPAAAPTPEPLEWQCPVPKCGRAHWSERVGNVWKPVEGTGAVGVFV